jgi:energy-coupling factor transport system permease protein
VTGPWLGPVAVRGRVATSLLARTSPLVLAGLGLTWLAGLVLVGSAAAGVALALAAAGAGWLFGGLPPRAFLRAGGAPLAAALGITLTNLVFGAANADPAAAELVRLGPLRLTQPALEAALALGARVLAIVATGIVFAGAVAPTRLADALVGQARVSPRFAYGALAAYGAVPRLADDLAVLRAVRRARGLAWSWHPRLFMGLLVRAIRHADQLALAMDARGFDIGRRSSYRPLRWGWPDLVVGVGGVAVLVAAIVIGG